MEKLEFAEKAKNWLGQTDFVNMIKVLNDVQDELIQPTNDDGWSMDLIRKIRIMKAEINDLAILKQDTTELV